MRLTLIMLSLLALMSCEGSYSSIPPSNDDDSADDDDSANDDDSADDDDATNDDDDDDSTAEGDCTQPGATACWGDRLMECQQSWWTELEQCGGSTPVCVATLGCVLCTPGALSCGGTDVVVCDSDGMDTTYVEDCSDGVCISGVCY